MKKTILIISLMIFAALAVFFILIPSFVGKMEINPSINLGIFEIRWYGLILATAILSAYLFARKISWKFGISPTVVDDYSFWAVIVSVIGARIYYVLFNLNYFLQSPDEIYKIWHGGLSIYGAILAGLVFSYFYSRNKAYHFQHLLDLVALCLPLGQAIGRFGNFVNQEAYGSLTNLPWKMYVAADGQFHHPAFLYESILDLAVFFILYKMLGKVKAGIIALSYLLLYSLGRFFIESIRVDSFFVNKFRVDQVLAFVFVVVSGWLILQKLRPRLRH